MKSPKQSRRRRWHLSRSAIDLIADVLDAVIDAITWW